MRLRFGGAVLDLSSKTLFRPKTWVFLIIAIFIVYNVINTFSNNDELTEKLREDDNGQFLPVDKHAEKRQIGNLGKSVDADLKFTIGKDQKKMAMDSIKPKAKLLKKVQKEMIRNMKRPDDSRYNINVTLSDMMSLDRDLPDTRPDICKTFNYDLNRLPSVTVIIPFYNEALTMLLRTIHSVLGRTPDMLLDQIIMVDDRSTDEFLKDPLDGYVHLLPKVTLVRNDKRVGLIESRMNGARLAKSPVLIFLDAHTEANEGWLPPLLKELEEHPKSVIQPFVDGIDTMSLEFASPQTYHVGAFSWDLRYTWMKLSDHEQQRAVETGHPFFTPTLVGCALVVRKDYFFDIGAFDEGLRIWGGENIELAWRTWMCGGRVVTVTCSRVGHVFKNFPYKFDGNKEDTVQKNLIRVSETWMDGLKKYFYASTRIYEFKRAELTADEQASLNERFAIRKRLNCKNFEWYMYNIAPEIEIPPMDAAYYGEIMNLQTRACWEVLDDYYVGMNYLCYEHKIIPKNNMALTEDGLLRYKDKCVKILPPKPYMVVAECPTKDQLPKFGKWKLKNKGHTWGQLSVERVNESGHLEWYCVVQVTNVNPAHYREQMPQIGPCDDKNDFQNWVFTYKFDFSLVPKHVLS